MKKILLLFALTLPGFAQTLSYAPPAYAAYLGNGSTWSAWTEAAGFGQLSYMPPAIGLYCQASAGAAWTPCTPGGGATYNPAAVAITGGMINGTTIGATTSATGAFTTLSTTGLLSLYPTASNNVVINAQGKEALYANSGGNFAWGGGTTSNFFANGLTIGSFTTTPNAGLCVGTVCDFKVTSNGQLTSTLLTGTAPLVVTSTTPVANLTLSKHPTIQYCGLTATCSATSQSSTQIVYGSAVLVSGTPSTVTITGISPFADTSYICTITSKVNAAVTTIFSVNNISTTSFQVDGTAAATDTFGYMCIGPK